MLTRRTFLAASTAAIAAPLPALAEPVKPFDPAAFAAAQAAGRPILVEIHAVWCGICKAQKAVIGELTAHPPLDAIDIFRVDFDDQKEVVQALGARVQSTLIVFKGKDEKGRIVGDYHKKPIEDLLRLVVPVA